MRKRFLAVITSFILIFSVGTTSALAENGPGASSLFTGTDASETAETGDSDSGESYSDADQTPWEAGEIDSDRSVGSAMENGDTSVMGDDGKAEETASDETLIDEDKEAEEAGGDQNESGEAEESGEDTEESGEDTEESGEDSEDPDEEDADDEEKENSEEGIALLSLTVDDYLNEKDLKSVSLQYDDRYDLSEQEEISSDTEYTIFMKNEDLQKIESYKVVNGEKSEEKDAFLITQIEEGSTKVAATGVGSGDVYIIATEDLEKLEEVGKDTGDQGEPGDGDTDAGDTVDGNTANGDADGETPNPEDKVDVYKLKVEVTAAPLTLMFLTGQSNMEGYCSSTPGYEIGASIACEDGTVYSTYWPSSASKAQEVTGISFNSLEVAGSLQGTSTAPKLSEDSDYSAGGTLAQPTAMSGDELAYPLNSLTESGSGKTGPDSGLAYEWHRQTGDKVWVVNTAYGSTEISKWMSGDTCYERSVEAWQNVLQTYEAEIAAGHYTNGSVSGNKLVFWLQGETNDSTKSADTYESSFKNVYKWMCDELGSNVPFGIIMVRAGYEADNYISAADLIMTGPRIAQYFLGSSNSSYSNVFVVSNANEQWVSDSGVESYFRSKYSGGFSYPMQSGSKSLPTTVNEVHSDIHYSQVGHNENGITAAYGMCVALGIINDSSSPTVTWKDEDGNSVTSLTLDSDSDYVTVVPVVDPVYRAKSVTYSVGDEISYDYSTGKITRASDTSAGTSKITPSGASGTLSVTVSSQTKKSEDVTDIVKIDGEWTYTVNGEPDYTYTGLAKNSNGWYYIKKGVLDRTYTGFATNENGSWYITEGKLTRKDNSVIKDTKGALGSTSEWYYVLESKVQSDFTGLADYSNDSGWWYITKGKVDRSVNTVAKNKNGWWYVKNGKVDKTYTGFASNENGSWYMENGKLLRDQNTVIKDTKGALGSTSEWYYVIGSKVQSDFTGLADYKNDSGWWYVTNGRVDRSVNTVAKNKNGWWYVLNGKVQKDFTGLANYKNDSGWWYITNGKVDRSVNTVAKNKNGWWYVVNGKVQKDFTGLANYKNDSGWWYITNGKVDRTFTGIAENKNGWYYLKNGKVQKSYTGTVTVNGTKYSVTNGKVAK